jgi:alpha-L-fucosidase
MKVNGEAVHGTKASPFKHLEWGRCTQKAINGSTRLYLHVFNYPTDGKLVVPGIFNQSKRAYLLSDPGKTPLAVTRQEDALVISVRSEAPDPYNSVIVLDVAGEADVSDPPSISADFDIFVDSLEVSVTSAQKNIELRYTLDGSVPSIHSDLVRDPLRLTNSTVVSARCFRDGKAVSAATRKQFAKVTPLPAVNIDDLSSGIRYKYFEGDWDSLPNFNTLKPVSEGTLPNFDFSPRKQADHFGFEYTGFVRVVEDGVYAFFTDSDDGSRLFIGDALVVDNDKLHPMIERRGVAALAAGLHPIRVTYFEKTGGDGLKVSYKGPNIEKQPIPDRVLFYRGN